MSTISEITQAAGYAGNAALGGYVNSAIDLDTKPVQQLLAFTVMQNKALYDQRVKDSDEKVKQLADLSKYDITAAKGFKDKAMAIEAAAQLQEFAAEYARKGVPKNPQEKIQQELELQTKIKDATDKIKSINGRGIAYQARLNAINAEGTTAEVKAEKKRQLDDELENTSWDTPISSEEKYDATFPETGKAVYTKNTTSVDIGNKISQQTVTIFNPGKTMDASFAEEAGLTNFSTLPENATPEQKRQFALRQASGGEMKTFLDASKFLNEALASPKYKSQSGDIDIDHISSDNRIAGNILKLIDRSNQYNNQLLEDINRGVYITKLGGKVNLANIIRKEDVVIIDTADELSPAQILYLKKFSEAAPDTKDEKVDFTGEDQRQQGLGVDWFNANTSRMNAVTSRITANKPAASSGGSGGSGSDQTVLLFGQHVNRLKNYFGKGAPVVNVSFENTDEITRKALGLQEGETVTYLPNGTAMVGSKGGIGGRPLTIEQLKANFIVAVKGGSKDDTSLDAKFLEDQESGFNSVLGTTSGTQIWDNWGESQSSEAPAPAKSGDKKQKSSDPTAGMTPAQKLAYYKNR